MTIKNKKSDAMQFLEGQVGGALTLGRLMVSIRVGEELSQTAFARVLGISRSHLCDIEHGRKSVSLTRAVRFAKLLGYSETQFARLALQAMLVEAKLDRHLKIEAA